MPVSSNTLARALTSSKTCDIEAVSAEMFLVIFFYWCQDVNSLGSNILL